MTSLGGEGDGGHVGLQKEYTVIVNVLDNSAVKAQSIIDSLTECVGFDSICAVIPKAGNTYWIILSDKDAVDVAVSGVRLGDTVFECQEYLQKDVVVSFLHLSPFISDEAIKGKLREYGVEVLSDVKKRKYGNSHIYDGTRYVKVRFPPNLKSLPYSVKFHNGESWEYCRVMHNGQIKTCRQCMSPDHMFKDCPDFVCFKCGVQGHMARACTSIRCPFCGRFGVKCQCSDSDDDSDMETDHVVQTGRAVSHRRKCDECRKFVCVCEDEEEIQHESVSDDQQPVESPQPVTTEIHAEVPTQSAVTVNDQLAGDSVTTVTTPKTVSVIVPETVTPATVKRS